MNLIDLPGDAPVIEPGVTLRSLSEEVSDHHIDILALAEAMTPQWLSAPEAPFCVAVYHHGAGIACA